MNFEANGRVILDGEIRCTNTMKFVYQYTRELWGRGSSIGTPVFGFGTLNNTCHFNLYQVHFFK